MKKYTEFNFSQKEGVDKEIIANKHWGNIENWGDEIDNVSSNIKTKRENQRLYKLINSNIGGKANLTAEFTRAGIGRVIINLKKKKTVGSDNIDAETFI